MAEFCLECHNRLYGTDLKEADVELEEDLCEGCGEYKPCVVAERPGVVMWFMRRVVWPVQDWWFDRMMEQERRHARRRNKKG